MNHWVIYSLFCSRGLKAEGLGVEQKGAVASERVSILPLLNALLTVRCTGRRESRLGSLQGLSAPGVRVFRLAWRGLRQ